MIEAINFKTGQARDDLIVVALNSWGSGFESGQGRVVPQ